MFKMILILCILLNITICVGDFTLIIDVNASEFTKFQHFWKSTGFCPPDPKEDISKYLLSDEQTLNTALIGALPNRGIKYIRIHWLLNLLTSRSENNEISYNFDHLDLYLSRMNNHRLTPIFELMGLPNSLVKFEKSGKFWSNLVKTLVIRYIEKFGSKKLSKWKFETWNEPDLKGYNVLNFTISEYLDYVNGCASGLKEGFSGSTSGWKFGGPAGLFRDKGHPLCWGLLEACNGVPRGDQCPLHFLSFHRKGGGSAQGVVNGSVDLVDLIHGRFPRLRKVAVANDEADIQENWSSSLEWRGDARYAAMVVRVVSGYYKSIVEDRKLKIEVLSNDNGFLNYHPFYFTQRTLFARFQMNDTTPPHSQFIRKPVYSAVSLLSFLGDQLLRPDHSESDPLLTVLATRRLRTRSSFVSVILAYGNETTIDSRTIRTVNVTFRNVGDGQWKYLVYLIDNVHTNPYEVWKSFGRPVFPNGDQRRKMREVEEPKRLINPTSFKGQVLHITLNLTIPSVHLINICKKSKKPKNVHTLIIFNVTWNEVLITWKYSEYTNCLRTFEVEAQSKCSGSKQFERINLSDTIFSSFHHVGKDRFCEWTRGAYRVRAKDYWDRAGEYSEIISYP